MKHIFDPRVLVVSVVVGAGLATGIHGIVTAALVGLDTKVASLREAWHAITGVAGLTLAAFALLTAIRAVLLEMK